MLTISKYRPNADILALTFDERVQLGLTVNWGVHPVLIQRPADTDDMFEKASQVAKNEGLVKTGDKIIVVAGLPVGKKGTTNLMRIQEIK